MSNIFFLRDSVDDFSAMGLLLPLGISFYTLSNLSYVIDIYKGKIQAEKNIFKLALFSSFFLCIVEGPISRYEQLGTQLFEKKEFCWKNVSYGVQRILAGFFKKLVIADQCAIYVNAVYDNYAAYHGFYIVIAAILYGIQLYADFSGCMDIVIGSAQMLGTRLQENFQAPYLATSVADFWRRWHISLSSWLKDYVYIPLGGNRKGQLRKYVNIMIVFLISGLWHGSQWSFVMWGGLHGAYQLWEGITAKTRKRINECLDIDENTWSHKLLRIIVTFACVDFAWIFFRAPGLRAGVHIIQNMFREFNIDVLLNGSLYQLGLDMNMFLVLVVAIILMFVMDVLHERRIRLRDWLAGQGTLFRFAILFGMTIAVILFGAYGDGYSASTFIYQAF